MTTQYNNKKIIPQPFDNDTPEKAFADAVIASLPNKEGNANKVLRVSADETGCTWQTLEHTFASLQGEPHDNAKLGAELDSKLHDFKLNGASSVTDGVAQLNTVDNVTSAGNQLPLTANQGKLLNDRINNLESIGRFLSLWNCTTGMPASNPSEMPYEYKRGDYYVVSQTGETNYMPHGSIYDGTASTEPITEDMNTGDVFRYDGTVWLNNGNYSRDQGVLDVMVDGVDVVSAGVANIPAADANNTGALTAEDWTRFDGKQNKIIVSTREPTEDEGEVGDIWLVIEP